MPRYWLLVLCGVTRLVVARAEQIRVKAAADEAK